MPHPRFPATHAHSPSSCPAFRAPQRTLAIPAAFGLALALAARAQLPQAVLSHVFPAGAAPGSTNVVTVQGSDLDEASGLVFENPRIVAKPKPGAPNAFEVVVPADVPEGFLDVRFNGRFGASNPRVVRIDRSPSLAATTNTSAAAALHLAPGFTAWGRVPAAGSAWFSVPAAKGSRVLLRVLAPELDSRLAPMIVAFGPDGREWARVRRSGLIDFTAPADGPARVQVLDAQFRGGDDFVFQIEHAVGPHVDMVVPCVVTAGVTNRVTLLGRRLPGGRPSSIQGGDGILLELAQVDVVAPSAATPGSTPWPVDRLRRAAASAWSPWTWTWATTNGPSNPVLLGITSLPVVAQPLPDANGVASRVPVVVPVTPPLDFGGWFASPSSGVTFDAKKGDTWWIEVVGERLGQVVDPLVLVQRLDSSAGKTNAWTDVTELAELDSNPASAELNVASRDAAGRFEAPQDGRYRVLVRDAFNPLPTSARRPFRLTLRRPSPDLRAWAWAQPPPKSNNDDRRAHATSTVLRRGGTLPLRVAISRLEGLEGPVDIVASGLPKGVTAPTARIPSGQSSATLLLTTADDAPAATFQLVLKASAIVASNRIERTVATGGVPWPVADFNQEPIPSRLHQSLHVGIAPESEPVSVAATGTDVIEAKAGGKLSIPLRIQRRYEYTAAFSLKPSGHPALEKAKEVSVPEKATNAVAEIVLSEAALPEGEHLLWLQGQAAGKYRNQPEAVAAAQASLKVAKDAVASATASDKPQAEERAKAAEAALKSAEERAKPRDVTLGVWSAPFRVRILPAK